VAITNGYATLAEVKASLAITDTQDDTMLEISITASSRMIDDYTDRFFYRSGTTQTPATYYYTPLDWWTCNIDDNVSISEVATDDNFDQTWSTVWATSDYFTEPINNPNRGWPITRLVAIDRYVFPTNLPNSLRVKGVFGWTAVPSEINQACIIQSSRLFVRKQSPFGIAGTPEIGTVRLTSRLDPDVEALIRPFKRNKGLAH
jgi:hypothetical protein